MRRGPWPGRRRGRGGAAARTGRGRGGAWPQGLDDDEVRCGAGAAGLLGTVATRPGCRRGGGARGRPRGAGAAGAGVGSGRPPGTRCRDARNRGGAGAQGRGRRHARSGKRPGRRRGRAEGGGGAPRRSEEITKCGCRTSVLGAEQHVSAGWPFQPALTWPRDVRWCSLVPAGNISRH